MCVRVARVYFDLFLKISFCARKIPLIIALHRSQTRVGFGKLGIDFERFPSKFLGLGVGLSRWQEHIITDNKESISQSSIGKRIFRVDGEGFLKIINGLQQILFSALVPEVSALQIQIIGLKIPCSLLNKRRLLFAQNLDLQGVDDGACYVILDGEDVLHFLVVLLRPELETVLRVDELG